MNQQLPRTYWCHADYGRPVLGHRLPPGTTTDAPGQAMMWMREAVRAVSPLLDRAAFHVAWGWLGDHRALNVAVIELRRGKPYTFAVPSPVGRWTWTVCPVSVLPLIPPDCLRCDRETAVQLGSLTVKSARRLVNAPQFGV